MRTTHLPVLALFVALLPTSCGLSVRGTPVPLVLPPVYTPAGTGLRNPNPPRTRGVPVLPLSPNKRILPPTREPGIWAADEPAPPPSQGHDVRLFDVPVYIPIVDVDTDNPLPIRVREERYTMLCVEKMTSATYAVKRMVTINNYSPKVRACMAARLYQYCVDDIREGIDINRTEGKPYADVKSYEYLEVKMHLNNLFVREKCEGLRLPPDFEDVFDDVTTKWRTAFMGRAF